MVEQTDCVGALWSNKVNKKIFQILQLLFENLSVFLPLQSQHSTHSKAVLVDSLNARLGCPIKSHLHAAGCNLTERPFWWGRKIGETPSDWVRLSQIETDWNAAHIPPQVEPGLQRFEVHLITLSPADSPPTSFTNIHFWGWYCMHLNNHAVSLREPHVGLVNNF